ncbi:MAG: C39 family peptidase [Clostridia bacterium]|nr:C39 family peptidase [Clostridia bacterium]
MKSKIKKSVIIFVIVMLLCVTSQTFAVAFAEETTVSDFVSYKYETIDDFMLERHSVSKETDITDFAGNQFVVYELNPGGYAIYSVNEDARVFIEGSYKTNSLFAEHYSHEIYYGGIGNYYCIEGEQIIDLVKNEDIGYDQVIGAYMLDYSAYIERTEVEPFADFPKNPDRNKTHTVDGFTVINNDNYFRNLRYFPDNFYGTCGLVAISILLGYFDEYIDDGFITNEKYKDVEGTNNKLHDLLFDNYMHTILNIADEGKGYPMAGYEIQETMKDYLKNECSVSLRNKVKHAYGSILYTHATPRKHINGGYPTIICMTSYSQTPLSSGSSEKYHAVVAYGYNKAKDTFLCHMGWERFDKTYTEIIVSNATIHSYYTINYTA